MTVRRGHTRTDPRTGRTIAVRPHTVNRPGAAPVLLTPAAARTAIGTTDPLAITQPVGHVQTASAVMADAPRLWPAHAHALDAWVVRVDGDTVLVSTHRNNPDGGLIEHVAVGSIVDAEKWGYDPAEAPAWIIWEHQTNRVGGSPTDQTVTVIDQREGTATPVTTADAVLAAATADILDR